MLVLSRRFNEAVMIGDEIEVSVVEVRGNTVRLGFDAPKDLAIHRKEVWVDIQRRKLAEGEQ